MRERIEYEARGWVELKCSCRGGLISDFRGGDFNGPMDCPNCNGGYYWRSPKGALAIYPGRPFIGRESGVEARRDGFAPIGDRYERPSGYTA